MLDLYERFRDVKVYYNFVFNPQEDKLMEECKFKITREYFPPTRRRPKARRSVAQNYIRHFSRLGMAPGMIAEVMLFNLETAQAFSAQKPVRQESFYISMLRSFQEAKVFFESHRMGPEYVNRLRTIAENAWKQEWFNRAAFEI